MRLSIRIKKDLSGIDKMERRVEQNADSSVNNAAEALAQDIKTHWSGSSPSAYGSAPAVVTGNLDSSVKVERTGRDELGRFTEDENAKVRFVVIETSKGDDPQDRGEYAGYLEEKLNRPFVEPAIRRLQGTFSYFFRRIFG